MGWEVNNIWNKPRLSGVTLGGTWCLSIEDAKALGGGCKSFHGCYQHVDKQLRFYSELNGIIIVVEEDEVASSRERTRKQGNVSTLSTKTGKHDLGVIKQLFTMEKSQDPDHEIMFTTRSPGKNGVNSFQKQLWKVTRTQPVIPYPRDELIFEEPDISHLSVKF